MPTGDHTYVVHSVSTRFGESQEGSQISMTMNYVEMMAPGNLTYSIANENDITLLYPGRQSTGQMNIVFMK